jgi:hypothetical protein
MGFWVARRSRIASNLDGSTVTGKLQAVCAFSYYSLTVRSK